MNLLAIFNRFSKPKYSVHREEMNIPIQVEKNYTEEELAAIILKGMGVSDVIINNPTTIYQLKNIMLKCLRECAEKKETIGSSKPGLAMYDDTSIMLSFSYNNLDNLLQFMNKKFEVLSDGGVSFELYEYIGNSTYQVKRPDGQMENQLGIKAYRFVYSPDGENVKVRGEGCELRTTEVAERFEKEAKEKYMTDFIKQKINSWYDPAILRIVERIFNPSGIEIVCEKIEGQSLYYYPYQFIADRKQLFEARYLHLIKQDRTRIERRADNLALATIILTDDDPRRNDYPPKRQYAQKHVVNARLDISCLPYIDMEADVKSIRESIRNEEQPVTVSIQQASLYDNGDENIRKKIETEVLAGIQSTACFGEQAEIIRTALMETAQKQFGSTQSSCSNKQLYIK